MSFSATTPSINAADVNVIHSTMTAITLERAPMLAMLCDRQFEGELSSARSTIINIPDLSATAAASRGRTDAYDDRSELGAQQTVHEIDKHYESGYKISYIDQIEVPWNAVAQANEAVASALMTTIDDQINTYWAGLTTKTITTPSTDWAAADLPKDDGSGNNTNAGSIAQFVYGTTGNIIPNTGVPSSDAAGAFVRDFLAAVSLRFERRNVWSGNYIGGSADPQRAFCVLPPELVKVLSDDLATQNYHWDELTSSLLRGPSILSTIKYHGTLYGIEIMSSNALPIPTGNASGTPWKFYAGTPRATALSVRPMFESTWSAQQNQTEPFAEVNRLADFGIQLINHDLLVEGQIKTAV